MAVSSKFSNKSSFGIPKIASDTSLLRFAPRNLIQFLLGNLFFVVSACAVPENVGVVRKGETIFIEGEITQRMAKKFLDLASSDIREIVVDSPGGNEKAAIAIARKMRQLENLRLTVNGMCLSSCTQYIFIAASRKVISRDAVVGCHRNILAARSIPTSAFGSLWTKDEVERSIGATRLYLRSGVKIDFALVCMASTIPVCACTGANGEKYVRSKFDAWIPTESDFRKFGVANVEGAPKTSAEAQFAAATLGLSVPQLTYSASLSEYEMEKMEACAVTQESCRI